MSLIVTKPSALVFIIVILFIQSGCDTFSEPPQSTEESKFITTSYEKSLLLDILERQKILIEELQYAHTNGDKAAIREFYDELLELDKSYQEEFDMHGGGLSNSEGLEISRKHHEIIKSIPSYSSLME